MIKRVIFSGAAVFWMFIIFAFSAQPADVSTETSQGVGYFIGNCFVSDFEEWSDGEREDFSEKIDFPVRKCAHASEYAVLAVLVSLAVASFGFAGAKGICITFIVTFLYASSDEFHQLFVPGRSGRFSDVLIDTAGGVAGCLLYVFVSVWVRRFLSAKKEKKANKNL